jgi:hypothetical protein
MSEALPGSWFSPAVSGRVRTTGCWPGRPRDGGGSRPEVTLAELSDNPMALVSEELELQGCPTEPGLQAFWRVTRVLIASPEYNVS